MLDSASPGPRSYTNLNPRYKWHHGDEADTLRVNVPGFNKKEMKVLINTSANIKIRGERTDNDGKWIRFLKEFQIPLNCNPNEIQAKLDKGRGLLYILLPKQANQGGNQGKRVASAGEDDHGDDRAPSRIDNDEGGMHDEEGMYGLGLGLGMHGPGMMHDEGGGPGLEGGMHGPGLGMHDEGEMMHDAGGMHGTWLEMHVEGGMMHDERGMHGPKIGVHDEGGIHGLGLGMHKSRIEMHDEGGMHGPGLGMHKSRIEMHDERGMHESRIEMHESGLGKHDEGGMHGSGLGMHGPRLGMSGRDVGTSRNKLFIINVVVVVMILLGIGGYAVYRIWFAHKKKEN